MVFSIFLAVMSLASYAQGGLVGGTVTDSDGNPLPGVGVVYSGTNTGTVTDNDGRFSIKAIKGKTLSFSFYGMQTRDIVVGDSSVIDVVLKEDRLLLDDAVVIGYGSLSRRARTGSVRSV
ncbi:MAG: carboxypeptidase-like regulatory domain-containing protein, partial [Bacteroidales bacterium]|nr:carboxypeptidase-like regulatory domain-containing protein [Bacteroidales bacterium]